MSRLSDGVSVLAKEIGGDIKSLQESKASNAKIIQIEETIATLQTQFNESIANLQRQIGDVDGLLLEINE